MATPESDAGVDDVSLSGRTALVTGATSGIGRHAAVALARLGATVLVHGRDRARGNRVVRTIERHSHGTFLPADFTGMAAVRRLAASVREVAGTLDVLVNNAGAYFSTGTLTEDGFERTMAVNHFAPFVLTNRLRPALADDGRVVTVSSGAHARGDMDFDRFTSVDGYDGFAAYSRSKLANVLFTRELARRLDGPTANCLHPGFIPGTGLWRDTRLPTRLTMAALRLAPDRLLHRVGATARSGAASVVYLTAAEEIADVTGAYFVDRSVTPPAPTASDDDLARRLWDESVRLTSSRADPAIAEPERT